MPSVKISRGIGPTVPARELPSSAGLGCAAGACGACCDPVLLSYRREWLDQLAADHPSERTETDSRFTSIHWHLIGVMVADAQAEHGYRPLAPGEPEPFDFAGEWRYSCDAYDPQSRLCMAHADRPPICAGALWYGGPPKPHSSQFHDPTRPDGLLGTEVVGGARAHCSYAWDLHPDQRPAGTRPLIPLEVL